MKHEAASPNGADPADHDARVRRDEQRSATSPTGPDGPCVLKPAASAAGPADEFAAVLAVLGGLRELVGSGTMLSNFQLLLGSTATSTGIELPFTGMLVAVLPPGAFFGLAFLVAGKNYLDSRRTRPRTSDAAEPGAL